MDNDATNFAARTWHLAELPEDEALTAFEFALLQVDQAFQRFSVHTSRLATNRELTFAEVVLLHLVRMHDRPKDAATLATLLNRDDLSNLLYTLRKLVSMGLVEKEKVGTAAVFRATEEGKAETEHYARLRKELLLNNLRQVTELQAKLTEATHSLQVMAGLYDAGARTASTMNPGAVRPT